MTSARQGYHLSARYGRGGEGTAGVLIAGTSVTRPHPVIVEAGRGPRGTGRVDVGEMRRRVDAGQLTGTGAWSDQDNSSLVGGTFCWSWSDVWRARTRLGRVAGVVCVSSTLVCAALAPSVGMLHDHCVAFNCGQFKYCQDRCNAFTLIQTHKSMDRYLAVHVNRL